MIKREVTMPTELVEEITQIVHKQGYTALKDAFSDNKIQSSIFLSQEKAEALIILAVIEKKKAWLMYPHYDDEDLRLLAVSCG